MSKMFLGAYLRIGGGEGQGELIFENWWYTLLLTEVNCMLIGSSL